MTLGSDSANLPKKYHKTDKRIGQHVFEAILVRWRTHLSVLGAYKYQALTDERHQSQTVYSARRMVVVRK